MQTCLATSRSRGMLQRTMTPFLVVFGLALVVAVLTSAVAARSPLSSSTVFLAAGLLAGPLALDLISVDIHHIELTAEIALFAILFTDGQHAPMRVLRRRWREPTLALLVGMPATFAIVAALGHWLAGLAWPPALTLGAILAPTDPVFASALVGREDVPSRVRETLNVESGLNDGLAFPAVLLFAGLAGGEPEDWTTEPGRLALAAALGVGLGVLLPLAIAVVVRLPGVGAVDGLLPLGPLSVAILVYGCCAALHANEFLAAFVAGATIATIRPAASEAFRHTGELASEIVKGVALVAFATLLDATMLSTAGVVGAGFAVAVILVSRPVPVLTALAGSRLTGRERAAVAWFGPKGFASVAYAVIVAFSDMESAMKVLALVAITVLISVVAHSSTDVAVARWLRGTEHGTEGSVGIEPSKEPSHREH